MRVEAWKCVEGDCWSAGTVFFDKVEVIDRVGGSGGREGGYQE